MGGVWLVGGRCLVNPSSTSLIAGPSLIVMTKACSSLYVCILKPSSGEFSSWRPASPRTSNYSSCNDAVFGYAELSAPRRGRATKYQSSLIE